MSKVVDVVLRLKDEMTPAINEASIYVKEHAKQWQKTGKSIIKTGKTITGVGKSLTTKLTVPIAGIGTAAVKTAADFEKGMSDVAAITNASGNDIEQLSNKAKSMDSLGFAADEVTEAYKYMGMAGWNTQQILAGTEPIMKLAAATNTELATTSDIVTDALTAFGATAEDTGRLADILATASTKSNTNVEMLGETFKYVAPVAGAMNYSMEETAAIAGLMANAGIKASNAGTAMRSAFTNLVAPTKDAAEGMAAIGLKSDEIAKLPVKQQMDKIREAFSGLSEAEQAAAAKAIAGKNGMSGLLAVVKASKKDYDGLTAAIQSSAGATDNMFKTSTNNLQGDLNKVKASLKNVGTEFGGLIMPYIKKGVSKLQSAIQWLKSLTDEEKKHILKIATVAASIGPALLVFGKMTTGIGTVVKALGTFGSAFSKLKTISAVLKTPTAVIYGIVAAIGLAVGFVIKHWNELKDSVQACLDAIKPIINTIKDTFQWLFNSISGGSNESGNTMVNVFKDALGTLADIIKGITPVVQGVIKEIGKILGTAINVAKKIFTTIKPIIVNTANIVGNLIKGIISFVSKLFAKIAPIITKVGTLVGKVVNKVVGFINKIVAKLRAFYQKHKKTIDAIVDAISTAIQVIVDAVSIAADVLGDIIGGILDVVMWVIDSITNAVEGIATFIGAIIDNISDVINGIAEVLNGIVDFIVGVFTLDWEKAWDGIKSIFTGIWDAMFGVVKTVVNGIIGVINGLIWGINCLIDGADWVIGLFVDDDEVIGHIPEIPYLAKGTNNWKGGIVQINERGGEIVDLPAGSRVYPHDKSVEKAYQDGAKSSSSNVTYNVNVSKFADELVVREDADIDKIATAIADKLEKVSQNIGSGRISYSYQN